MLEENRKEIKKINKKIEELEEILKPIFKKYKINKYNATDIGIYFIFKKEWKEVDINIELITEFNPLYDIKITYSVSDTTKYHELKYHELNYYANIETNFKLIKKDLSNLLKFYTKWLKK